MDERYKCFFVIYPSSLTLFSESPVFMDFSECEGWVRYGVGFNKFFVYDNPTISSSTMSMRFACGVFGNPGIRIISPAMTTIISAPLLTTISRT